MENEDFFSNRGDAARSGVRLYYLGPVHERKRGLLPLCVLSLDDNPSLKMKGYGKLRSFRKDEPALIAIPAPLYHRLRESGLLKPGFSYNFFVSKEEEAYQDPRTEKEWIMPLAAAPIRQISWESWPSSLESIVKGLQVFSRFFGDPRANKKLREHHRFIRARNWHLQRILAPETPAPKNLLPAPPKPST